MQSFGAATSSSPARDARSTPARRSGASRRSLPPTPAHSIKARLSNLRSHSARSAVSWSSRSSFRSIEVVEGPALWPTIGLAVLAVFLQTMFAQFVTFRGGTPSLVTIAVVLYAAKVGARRGALFGIIAGVLEDCFAGTGGAWTGAATLDRSAVD